MALQLLQQDYYANIALEGATSIFKLKSFQSDYTVVVSLIRTGGLVRLTNYPVMEKHTARDPHLTAITACSSKRPRGRNPFFCIASQAGASRFNMRLKLNPILLPLRSKSAMSDLCNVLRSVKSRHYCSISTKCWSTAEVGRETNKKK